jgi:GT2 family glycosyltransferase
VDEGTRPRTAVVICSRERRDLLRDTVAQVLRMSLLPDELVVVDQSDEPDEHLASMVGDSGVVLRYEWGPDRGLSRARNRGLRATTADLVVVTDDDILVDVDWLATAVEALLERGPRCVVTGQVRAGDPEHSGAWVPSTKEAEVPQQWSGKVDLDPLYAGNLAFWRSAWTDIGPFDERLGAGARLPAAEDNDWGYRALRSGYTIEYLPHVVVTHRAWREEGGLAPLMHGYGMGQGGFYAKHVREGDRWIARRAVRDLVRHVRRSAVLAVKGNRAKAVSDLAYSLGLVRGAARWWVGP